MPTERLYEHDPGPVGPGRNDPKTSVVRHLKETPLARDLMISAHSVASLLAHAFGPSFYDGPWFDHGDPSWHRAALDLVGGPRPEPWRAVALNPQPLPPGPRHAMALADAHIQEVLALDRAASLLGEESSSRAQDRMVQQILEVDELCPRWPNWPKRWPPPPPPPWQRDEMNPAELFLFGARFLAASELLDQGRLQDALGRLGEKAIGLSVKPQIAAASAAA